MGVIHRSNRGKISRQQILFKLAEELAEEFQNVQQKEQDIKEISSNSVSCVRKKCQIKYCNENKTSTICFKCKKYMCGKCIVQDPSICKICAKHKC